jgi:hypothetical protein
MCVFWCAGRSPLVLSECLAWLSVCCGVLDYTAPLLDNEHLTCMNCYGATCNLAKVMEECTPEDDALASKHVG